MVFLFADAPCYFPSVTPCDLGVVCEHVNEFPLILVAEAFRTAVEAFEQVSDTVPLAFWKHASVIACAKKGVPVHVHTCHACINCH